MKGWSIFSHSVSMLLRNFQAAMQIFLVPTILAIAVVAGGIYVALQSEVVQPGQQGNLPPGLIQILAVVSVAMLIGIWSVVAWHRYVLLEEMPKGWVPRLNVGNITRYVLRMLQVGLVAAIGLMIVAFIGWAFVQSAGYFGIAVVFALVAGLSLFLSRLMVVFPAAAIGKPFGLSDALKATKGAVPALFLLFVCMFILQFAIEFALTLFAAVPVLGLVLQLGFSMVLGILHVSIMTTLYGHYVEGRPV